MYIFRHELLLFEALREGLEEEMDRDPTVYVMSEDVGHDGGSYKVTKGLAPKYGDLRVLDTPIAENAFTGMGIGAAMTGLRPIVEGMNMGFLLLAFNQILTNCGMLHYTSGGQFKIPIVIRGPGRVGRQLGAEHSQWLESYFQSIPRIQMVACSTPYNANGLMKAAIRSDNPMILFEHVLLMRYHVMQAVKTLVNKGYDPEVIDIRMCQPHMLGHWRTGLLSNLPRLLLQLNNFASDQEVEGRFDFLPHVSLAPSPPSHRSAAERLEGGQALYMGLWGEEFQMKLRYGWRERGDWHRRISKLNGKR
ncbi:hypothetical protein RND71_035441 [Anisodus tanguticus]|uniref:pyruvate dehydrogenase (acetyl-transferring) n=1 Tax=Anisodus tanguticus TaxID=243964 RepID=A0AAE1V273_9SOLA|nr:hypothetical protein RND71_035441 [Anisodus tanguticus]